MTTIRVITMGWEGSIKQEVLRNWSSRPLPRTGDFVDFEGKTWKATVVHKVESGKEPGFWTDENGTRYSVKVYLTEGIANP